MSASSNCGAPSSSGEGAQEGSDISLSVLPKPERHTVYSVEPDEESCAVCFSGVTYEGSNNEILFCDGCDTAYHQQCYGVQTLPGEDDKWFCDECLFKRSSDVVCAICSQGGSGMKRTDQKGEKWAHISCALEINECYFGDTEQVSSIRGVDKIKKARFGLLKCIVCKERKGAKIQCSSKHCTVSFHPRCGLKLAGHSIDHEEEDGYDMSANLVGKLCDSITLANGTVHSWWSWYCQKHLKARKAGTLTIQVPKWEEELVKREKREKKELERERAREEKKKLLEKKRLEREAQRGKRRAETVSTIDKEHRATKNERRRCFEEGCDKYKIAHSKRCRNCTRKFGAEVSDDDGGSVMLEEESTSSSSSGSSESSSEEEENSDADSIHLSKRMGCPKGAKDLKPRNHREDYLQRKYGHEGALHLQGQQVVSAMISPSSHPNDPLISSAMDDGGESEVEFDEDPAFRREDVFVSRDEAPLFDEEETWKNTVTGGVAKSKREQGMSSARFWHIIRDYFEPLDSATYSGLVSEASRKMQGPNALSCKVVQPGFSHRNCGSDVEVGEKAVTCVRELDHAASSVSVYFEASNSVAGMAGFKPNVPSTGGADGSLDLELVSWKPMDADEELDEIDLGTLEQEYQIVCKKNISNFKKLLTRVQSVSHGEPIRLGGEDDIAPDGNLRYPGLAKNLQITSVPQCDREMDDDSTVLSLLESFQALAAWREVSLAFERGNQDQEDGFNAEIEDAILIESLKARGDSRANEALDEEDDVVCQICFDGKSTELNPILLCDRCNMALHQRCYGVMAIPEGSFFCRRCEQLNSFRKKAQKDVFRRQCCRICGHKDGAMKRAEGGAWVHLFCAMWTPGVRIEDVRQMTDIRLPPSVKRGVNAFNPCACCKKSVGPLVRCSYSGCTVEYHPYCAWYAGYMMTAKSHPERDPVGDATKFIDFQSFCFEHSPSMQNRANCEKRRADQVALRQKYRNVFPQDTFIHDRKQTGKTRMKKTLDDRERLIKLQRLTALKRSSVGGTGLQKYTEPLPPDEYRSDICSVCFVQSKPSKMLVCVDCKVTVHEECYGPDKTSTCYPKDGFRCDLCIELHGIPLAQRPKIKCLACPRSGGAYKRAHRGKWIHAYCAYWVPGAMWRDDNTIDASKIHKSCFESKCVLCRRGGRQNSGEGACTQCSHDGCYRTYHPLCAKLTKCFTKFVKRPDAYDRVTYCPDHTPKNMKYNEETGVWKKIVSKRPLPAGLMEMLMLRKQFDRARTYVDIVRKQSKLARREFEVEKEAFERERSQFEPRGGPMARRTRKEMEEFSARCDIVRRERKNSQPPLPNSRDIPETNVLKRKSCEEGSDQSKSLPRKNARKVAERVDPASKRTAKSKKTLKTSPAAAAPWGQFPSISVSTIDDFDKCMTPQRGKDMKLKVMEALLSKRAKSTKLIELDALLSVMFQKLDEATDENGQEVSEYFQELPDPEEFCDYYKEIKKPISMREIRESIQHGQYTNVKQMTADFNLLLKNAKSYNDIDSDIYRHARAMEKHLKQEMCDLQNRNAGYSSPPQAVRNHVKTTVAALGGAPCGICEKKTKSIRTAIPPPLKFGQYFCDDCMRRKEHAKKLINRQVHVFWPTDNAWYRGIVNCYDEESRTHRVLYYEDVNWEFIDFAANYVQFEYIDTLLKGSCNAEVIV